MRFIISEDERKQIKLLYEQQTTVSAITLNDIAIGLLPSNFVKTINTELNQNDELKEKVNQIYNEQLPKNPLMYLQSKGVVPYIFLVPNYITGVGFPTTGLAVKIGNTPITVSLNLGTSPKDIPSSLKFSRVSMNLPLSK